MKLVDPKVLILDVDGVMTTGQFLYSDAGKQNKVQPSIGGLITNLLE